jgi:cytidylate kinase
VAEGRDIGTVVAPDAEVKVFLIASPQARARRRAAELGADEATVLADQAIRDQRDTERAHSPLQAAPDAETIDTTELTLPEAVARVVDLVRAAGT